MERKTSEKWKTKHYVNWMFDVRMMITMRLSLSSQFTLSHKEWKSSFHDVLATKNRRKRRHENSREKGTRRWWWWCIPKHEAECHDDTTRFRPRNSIESLNHRIPIQVILFYALAVIRIAVQYVHAFPSTFSSHDRIRKSDDLFMCFDFRCPDNQ